MASPPGTDPKTGGLTTPLPDCSPPALDTAARTLLWAAAVRTLLRAVPGQGLDYVDSIPRCPPPILNPKGASSKLRLP